MSSYVFTEEERRAAREVVGVPPMQRIAKIRAELEDAPAPADQPVAAPAVQPQLGRHTHIQTIGALVIILAMAGLAVYARLPRTSQPAAPVVVLAPTMAPPSLPTPAPTPLPPNGLPRAIVAYAAPGGAVLGPIEPGRAYTATARYGMEWVQLDVLDSGQVWTEAGIVDVDLTSLPDLTPPTPLPAPQPAQPSWEPPPAPEPTAAPMAPAAPRYREDDPTVPPRKPNEMEDTRPTNTMIVPRLPPRVKPQQPPVNQDSGQSPVEVQLAAAGWPVAMLWRWLP
jgi:hypothetical protein